MAKREAQGQGTKKQRLARHGERGFGGIPGPQQSVRGMEGLPREQPSEARPWRVDLSTQRPPLP